MTIARTFLDWTEPALPMVVEYLVQRFQRGTTLDLDNVILVFPGGRAGRRLTELLVAYCDEHSLVLLPPEHCTVGTLPEYLYESHRPFASELTQQLAWVKALKAADRDHCKQFICRLPDDNDYANWMDLGGLLQRQHRELAADALNFAHVAERGALVPGFEEKDRWDFLSLVQQDYLRILDELQLWDLQTARLFAIEHDLCRTDKQIALVGTTDMTIAMRRMLDQVADQVTAVVHAPEELADRFDTHGCLNPDAWQETPIDLETEQIHVVEGPSEQARETVQCLAAFGGKYRADQIVIGVLDELLVPQLLRQLDEHDVAARWVVGRTLRETPPYQLLEAFASYLERGRFIDFAALVRHADVSQWLTHQVETEHWLTELDDYYAEHLQPRLGTWLDERSQSDPLKQVVSFVHNAAEPLRGPARPLAKWAAAIAQLLATFYGDRMFQVDRPQDLYTLRSLEHIRAGLLMFQEVPDAIAPTLSAAQTITQLLSHIAGAQIPSPRADAQIELLGWLELPLDTAPTLIVTGFNEGNVPTSVNSDLFLPNQLRQQLDLVDNRRRYARDAYALSVLQASHEDLVLIAGRFSAEHDPLAPSRLMFATELETMARRALSFFQSTATEQAVPAMIIPVGGSAEASNIVVPRPRQLAKPIDKISVTAFRTYLECPYRFYLRHVLKLSSVDDTAEELGPALFGTLIHDVLKEFGKGDLKASTDPEKIDRFLQQALDQQVTRLLGNDHLPAVDVQIELARKRLSALAQWQAQRAREGWEIAYTETPGKGPVRLNIDSDTSVLLRGRIDRIDRRGDQWAVLDYKTGDAAKTPKETHLKGGEWIDLQLPLYVHLARSLNIEGPLQLGYILLPKETGKTGASMADWDNDARAAADEKALQVASDIVAGKFWPPRQPLSGFATDFAAICQEQAFRPRLEGAGQHGDKRVGR